MITLNTEKGLVHIEAWAEITSRPGFTSNLDSKTTELKAIIGQYTFKDYVKCGLSTCHQPHGRGFLVTTTDGRETNIGKDCGRTHFEVNFEVVRAAYMRDYRNKERREQLEAFQIQIPKHLATIESLRSGAFGADALYKHIQVLAYHGRGVPETVVDQLTRMTKAQDGRITIQRQATDLEIENIEAINGKSIRRPHYIEEEVGHLSGIAALKSEYDLRELLVFKLLEPIKHIRTLNIEVLSEYELRLQSKWISELDIKFDMARQAIREARLLLSPSNLCKLDSFIKGKDEKRSFQKFITYLKDNLGDKDSLAA